MGNYEERYVERKRADFFSFLLSFLSFLLSLVSFRVVKKGRIEGKRNVRNDFASVSLFPTDLRIIN